MAACDSLPDDSINLFRLRMGMRFIHCADLHLGVENYGRIDPATGLHSRLKDFVRCLESLVEKSLDERLDFVLFAGDIYKSPNPNPTWQREFATQLRRLQTEGIPAVIVVGNHDSPTTFGRATSVDIFNALALEDTHVIRHPRLLRLPTRSGIIQIAGLPWPTRHFLRADASCSGLSQDEVTRRIEEMCAAQISEFAGQLDPANPAVLCAHITAAEATYSGSERRAVIGLDPTLLTGSLANPAFDYVALGHVHRHQNLNPNGAPPVVYSGSLDRIDFGEEAEAKGFCLVTIEDRKGMRAAILQFMPTPARRFVTIEADARRSGCNPTEAILEAIGHRDIADAIVRVIYDVAEGGLRTLDLGRIRAALETAHFVAGIHPRTPVTPRQRRASIAEDTGLAEALDRYIDNNPELQSNRQTLVARALELERTFESGEEI